MAQVPRLPCPVPILFQNCHSDTHHTLQAWTTSSIRFVPTSGSMAEIRCALTDFRALSCNSLDLLTSGSILSFSPLHLRERNKLPLAPEGGKKKNLQSQESDPLRKGVSLSQRGLREDGAGKQAAWGRLRSSRAQMQQDRALPCCWLAGVRDQMTLLMSPADRAAGCPASQRPWELLTQPSSHSHPLHIEQLCPSSDRIILTLILRLSKGRLFLLLDLKQNEEDVFT